jgi:hypothetical protein
MIVIAWLNEEQEFDGEPYAKDLGARSGLRTVLRPVACVWSRSDLNKQLSAAKEHLRKERPDGAIFVYPSSERDPLGRAKSEILIQKGGVK